MKTWQKSNTRFTESSRSKVGCTYLRKRSAAFPSSLKFELEIKRYVCFSFFLFYNPWRFFIHDKSRSALCHKWWAWEAKTSWVIYLNTVMVIITFPTIILKELPTERGWQTCVKISSINSYRQFNWYNGIPGVYQFKA